MRNLNKWHVKLIKIMIISVNKKIDQKPANVKLKIADNRRVKLDWKLKNGKIELHNFNHKKMLLYVPNNRNQKDIVLK